MTGAIPALSRRLLLPVLAAICFGATSVFTSAPALARGPDGIADVAEKVIDAVVNISTSQTIEAKGPGGDGRGAIHSCLRVRRSRNSSTIFQEPPRPGCRPEQER